LIAPAQLFSNVKKREREGEREREINGFLFIGVPFFRFSDLRKVNQLWN